MRDLKTEGFILKRIPYQNENTKLFSVLTKDFGKILLSSRTAKKISSSIRVLAPLNVCEIEIYKSSSGFFKAKSVKLKHSFHPTHVSSQTTGPTDKLAILQKIFSIADIINEVVEEGHIDPLLYELTLKTALIIEQIDNELIFETFKTKLLNISGNLPNLKYCFGCKEKFSDNEIWINEINLHVFCKICCQEINKYDPITKLSFSSLKLLHFISTATFENILKINAPAEAINTLKTLNQLLLTQIIHTELRTTKKPLT